MKIRVLCEWPLEWLRWPLEERCAFLLGKTLPGVTYVFSVIPCPNASDDPTRFAIRRGVYNVMQEKARLRGLRVIGLVHTHPGDVCEPSDDDLVGLPPGWLGAIWSDDRVTWYDRYGVVA